MRRSSLLIPLLFASMTGSMGLHPCPSRGDDSSASLSTHVVSDPYLVFVAEEAAHLRCGPSGDYYRTDPLRHGQELEVYVETEDGWLGVRPTEDSFCWIPADVVRLMNSRDADSRGAIRSVPSQAKAIEAEVIEDKTVAWIGTNLGRARRYRWQVQLGEGEIVTVLGSSERDGPDGPQTWYRIVPPSGEFRWVHRDQTVNTAEELIQSVRESSGSETIEFLPAGPTIAGPSIAQSKQTSGRTEREPIRQVSSEQVWETPRSRSGEAIPTRTAASTGDSDLSIDAIEQRIAARQRGRLGTVENDLTASDRTSFEQDQVQPDVSSHTGHPQSFSQRVTQGLSSLIKGRNPNAPELHPISPEASAAELAPTAQSSRRVPDLVPIGSGLIASGSNSVRQSTETPIETPTKISNWAQSGPTQSSPAQSSPTQPNAAQPIAPQEIATSVHPADDSPKNVEASHQPGLRSTQSQVAFLSAPRMVSPANTSLATIASTAPSHADFPNPSKLASLGTPEAINPVRTVGSIQENSSLNSPSNAPGRFLPPSRTRTIQAEQLEQVRRSVAASTPESLSMELSKLMARGASAPEIALVAEAAQQIGNRELSTRARDYQMLARRRDGDTIVASANPRTPSNQSILVTPAASTNISLAMSPTLPALSFPDTNTPLPTPLSTPLSTPTNPPVNAHTNPPLAGQFVPRSEIAKTSFTPSVISGPASDLTPVQNPVAATGILVQVYSADPSRPPYAITDRGGRTLAYVTPAPGVEVKKHLGSEVTLTGETGYLQGLDTQHVLATSAQRVLR